MPPESLAERDPATLVAGDGDWIGPDLAVALAAHPLDCVDTAFPHHTHAAESTDDVPSPREDHPVFYGCFDWHSAVHSHLSLVRGLRLFDDHPDRSAIVEGFVERITPANVDREVAYFEDNPGFENPYGWGWFLRLVAELALWDDPRAGEWRGVLRPLEDRVVELVGDEFLARPFRVGTHGNSAFALACVLDHARVVGEDSLAADAVETTHRFYGDDTDAPVAYEPLGWDFVSPSLTEADLMRRVLDAAFTDDYAGAHWLSSFVCYLLTRDDRGIAPAR